MTACLLAMIPALAANAQNQTETIDSVRVTATRIPIALQSTARIVTLLDKPARRRADIKADYCGFSVPDEFVVGFGLDYAEQYRNLPYIGILKPEIYSR